MKRKYLLLSFVAVALLTLMNTTKVSSNKTFARPGYCGDPTTSLTCVTSGCHGGTPQAASLQNVLLKIGQDTLNLTDTLNSAFQYVPGQTYYINFNVLATGYAFGFETVALDGTNAPAGSFTVTSPHTAIHGGYMSHNIAAHAYNSWLFQWTAPATNVGPVIFYYAFNSADSAIFGNYVSAVPDSNIFVGTVVINEKNGVGINEVAGKVSSVQVYPNPVSGTFLLSFDALTSGNASASLYSVDGKLCKQLFNEGVNGGTFTRSFDVSSVSAGIYFVKLNVDGGTVTKKIIVQ